MTTSKSKSARTRVPTKPQQTDVQTSETNSAQRKVAANERPHPAVISAHASLTRTAGVVESGGAKAVLPPLPAQTEPGAREDEPVLTDEEVGTEIRGIVGSDHDLKMGDYDHAQDPLRVFEYELGDADKATAEDPHRWSARQRAAVRRFVALPADQRAALLAG